MALEFEHILTGVGMRRGKIQRQARWQLRLWWKPLVTLIWLGGALVAIGGFLSLVGRLRRDMALSERQAYA